MHAMHMREVEYTMRRGLRTQHDAWINHTEKRCRNPNTPIEHALGEAVLSTRAETRDRGLDFGPRRTRCLGPRFKIERRRETVVCGDSNRLLYVTAKLRIEASEARG